MINMLLKSMGVDIDFEKIIPMIEDGRKIAIEKIAEFEARLGDLEQASLSANAKLDRLLEYHQPSTVADQSWRETKPDTSEAV